METTSGGPLPPPSSAVSSPTPTDARAGQLTSTWRILLGLAWLAAFFAYAAVWQASVQLGISTWWIGPRAQPTSDVIRLIPFATCLAVTMLVVYGFRRLPQIGAVVSLGLVALSVPDFGRSTSLALCELAIALALLITSLAATTGQLRAAPDLADSAASDR